MASARAPRVRLAVMRRVSSWVWNLGRAYGAGGNTGQLGVGGGREEGRGGQEVEAGEGEHSDVVFW